MVDKEQVKAGVIAGCIVLVIVFLLSWAVTKHYQSGPQYDYLIIGTSTNWEPQMESNSGYDY